MGIVVVTPPEDEPVSLEAAKLHLEEIGSAHDDLIARNIKTARRTIEQYCDRALMPQIWRLSLPAFPAVIELSGGLVREIDKVEFIDQDGELQELAPTAYDVDLESQPAKLAPVTAWPATARRFNAVRVTYQVGYEDADAVPSELVSALLLIVGDLFDQRSESVVGESYVVTHAVDSLTRPYRRMSV